MSRLNKKVKRIFAAAAAAILILTAVVIFTRPIQVETVTAEVGEVQTWFVEDGIISSKEDYAMYSEVGGAVLEVCVRDGSYVADGTVIARIAPKDYEDEIQLRTRNIETYRAEELIALQNLSLDQCRLEVDYSKGLMDKNAALLAEGFISQADYDVFRLAYDTWFSKLSQAEAQSQNIRDSYAALIAAEEDRIVVLNDLIQKCTITANRSGYLSQLPVANSSIVNPMTLICTIKEEQAQIIESYVTTEDVVHIKTGNAVELVQKTREGELVYSGTITEIAAWAEEQVSALGVEEHRVKVTIEPEQEIQTAGSGYNLDVKYITFVSDSSIALPNSAFYRFDEVDYVFVIARNGSSRRGTLRAVPVVKGLSTGTETVVLDGVNSGEVVLRNVKAQDVMAGSKVGW